MSQHDFDELLQKYLAGACDPAEEKVILNWYQDMTAQRPEPVDAREKAAIRQRVWQKLAANTTQKVTAPVTRRMVYPYWPAVAVCLVLLLTAGLWRYTLRVAQPAPSAPAALGQGSIELKNISPKPQLIRLEDGTLVTLKPGGMLSYPEHFGRQNRTVFLKGEAFFRVKRNPGKPFMVHTGDLITEVLGTSFTIKSYEGAKDIEVAVVTGRVSVYRAADGAHRPSKEVILKPNERITYSPQSRLLIPALVEQPIRVQPPARPVSLFFEGTPLPDVLARLQALYGIDMFLESDGLTDCVLNADLNDLSMHDQLELICKSTNALYEVRGTSIFIKGSGCR